MERIIIDRRKGKQGRDGMGYRRQKDIKEEVARARERERELRDRSGRNMREVERGENRIG